MEGGGEACTRRGRVLGSRVRGRGIEREGREVNESDEKMAVGFQGDGSGLVSVEARGCRERRDRVRELVDPPLSCPPSTSTVPRRPCLSHTGPP